MKTLNSKKSVLAPLCLLALIIFGWQVVSTLHIVPQFMLPSPASIINALYSDSAIILYHTYITLVQAFTGVFFAVILSFIIAFIMDCNSTFYAAIFPLLVASQTIPTIAIAPVFVLWFGYGSLSKIILIVLTCFFPITVSLSQGFSAVDGDEIALLRSFGAKTLQIFWLLKIPSSIPYFLSGLKITLSYSIVTAVVSQWLGGNEGLGVYMIRVKKSYSFDKMFAAIVVVSAISLILMKIVTLVEKKLNINV